MKPPQRPVWQRRRSFPTRMFIAVRACQALHVAVATRALQTSHSVWQALSFRIQALVQGPRFQSQVAPDHHRWVAEALRLTTSRPETVSRGFGVAIRSRIAVRFHCSVMFTQHSTICSTSTMTQHSQCSTATAKLLWCTREMCLGLEVCGTKFSTAHAHAEMIVISCWKFHLRAESLTNLPVLCCSTRIQ
eukprot:SAG31_NODE_1542_length_7951_cov_4.038844_7_plen_190_part_00